MRRHTTRLTTRTSFGTLITLGGGRSSAGFPIPTSLVAAAGLWFVGLRPQRQPHPESGQHGRGPDAQAAQVGLPGYRPCGLQIHAGALKRTLGAAGERGRGRRLATLPRVKTNKHTATHAGDNPNPRQPWERLTNGAASGQRFFISPYSAVAGIAPSHYSPSGPLAASYPHHFSKCTQSRS
jgi:hypothetical protein